MQRIPRSLPISDHFELEQLADGVYAAIALPGSSAFSNAGIVDLGDQTLVFDTFETPIAAQDLRTAAEHLTGRPVSCVVISHSHADHWCGNQAFGSQVPIITTHAIREEMPASIGWLRDLKENPSQLEQSIEEEQEHLETESDPRWRASIESSITRMRHWLTVLPTLEFRFPNQTFDGRLVFHGKQRRAELVSVAPGHTPNDVCLVLPEERIMFAGDLGFFQCQPFMVFCEPEAWKAWLENMEQSEIETFVPGHGPLGTKADIALQRRYIIVLEGLVAEAIEDEMPVEEVLGQRLPAPFDAWLQGSMARWEANVRMLYGRLTGEPVS